MKNPALDGLICQFVPLVLLYLLSCFKPHIYALKRSLSGNPYVLTAKLNMKISIEFYFIIGGFPNIGSGPQTKLFFF